MEHILTPKVENVKLQDKFNAKASSVGTLYLTTTHLIFVSNNPEAAPGAAAPAQDAPKKELWILHMLIHTVDTPKLTTCGTQLVIHCSHFQQATFIITKDKDAHDVYQSLLLLSKPTAYGDLYCFSYNPKGEVRQSTGWQFHDLTAEFQRQGVPNENWTITSLNFDYSICPTYPKELVVPTLSSKSTLDGSAKFRSKGRIPVLTYLHKNNAAIIRCAQPLVGFSGMRSGHDENYVEDLRKATPGAPYIHVIDTRPQINAIANRAGGKGYENEKYYENIKFAFRGIENIHKMRSSLNKMIDAVNSNTAMESFLSELANSSWLQHVKAVLDTSMSIMSCITEGKSVIVHCSDGWDRTAQTCALSCLLLDGYYRTVQGFQALIEKDWLAFGHKFSDRCGHLDGDPNEVSPTFTQFLDCVWQLMQLSPQAFQFNERYLISIHEHVYSCQYGTFLGNCQRERAQLQLKEKCYSLWGFLITHNEEYINPLYDAGTVQDILRPDTSAQNIKFWSGLYCRFEHGAHPREPVIDLLTATQNQTSSLEDHGRQLTKTIGQMTSMLATAKSASKSIARMMPTSPNRETAPSSIASQRRPAAASSSAALAAAAKETGGGEVDAMGRKFNNLTSSIVEKCQSKFTTGSFMSLMSESIPILQQTINMPAPNNTVPPVTSLQHSEIQDNDETEDDSEVVVLSGPELHSQLNTVAVDWKPLRHCHECCSCGYSLQGSVVSKIHCRSCGQIFCKRCSLYKIELPGHFDKKAVPVCNKCHKMLAKMRCRESSEDNGFTQVNLEDEEQA